MKIQMSNNYQEYRTIVAEIFSPKLWRWQRATKAFNALSVPEMTKIAEVEAKDYEGTNRRWTIYLVFSSGASQTVFGHGKYNLYFQAEKTQQEIEEEERWLAG